MTHELRNLVNFIWRREVVTYFTKLSFINGIERKNTIIRKMRVINNKGIIGKTTLVLY
jgi:hypothetical protein